MQQYFRSNVLEAVVKILYDCKLQVVGEQLEMRLISEMQPELVKVQELWGD